MCMHLMEIILNGQRESVTFLMGSKNDPVQVTCLSQLVAMYTFLIQVQM